MASGLGGGWQMSFSTRLHTGQSQVFRMGHIVNVLQMSGEELNEHLLQAARDNPLLVVRQRRRTAVHAGTARGQIEAAQADTPTSLYDHVLRDLAGLIAHGGPLERLVLALVEEIEPSGWLGRPVAEIAADLSISVDLVEKGLDLVQKRVTPAGLFARDLADCLRLQLVDQDLWDAETDIMLRHLGVLEQGDARALAAATGLAKETVARHLKRLRQLDPKPGARFSTDLTLSREPDVRVEAQGDGWIAIVKSAFETQVSVLPEVSGDSSPELKQALMQACALKQALDLRQNALKQIMRYMLDVQGDYFRDGLEALHPLTQATIAQKTGFHLSTVSRVLNGLLIEGPHGIVEARTLCAHSASHAAQNCPSKPKVLSRLRAALRAECAAHPLSDQDLTDLLGAEGLAVSRRVVAKYRLELGFAPLARRRLRA